MIILYAPKSDQKTEIVIPEDVTKIACNVSGGADSAILFYILSKYIKDSGRDITILPVNRTYMDRPTVKDAILIVEKIRQLLGGDTSFIKELHSEIECKKTPRLYQNWFELKLLESGDAEMLFDSITANPKTQDFYDQYKMYGIGRFSSHEEDLPKRLRIFSNEFGDSFPDDFPTFYRERPFCNVDKKFISEMYDLYKLRDELLPITWSCEGSYLETNGFTEPCKGCFNCHEKNWGVGHYDLPRHSYTSEIKKLEFEDWTDWDWHWTDRYKEYLKTKPWWWRLLNKYFFKLHRQVGVHEPFKAK